MAAEPAAKFRIDAKQFFLTYPQCNLSREELRDELLAHHDIDWMLVA